ncbi:MAG: GAF domain-containing protein [Candidatus Eisenbacteria bacterium]|nr:GAF domain-containing protein [Candidatus Eisenbacteria bacterium]
MERDRLKAYRWALEEIRSVADGENDAVANLANAAAILFEALPFSWVGFYRVSGDELVLGPFQGRPACVRIARGRGVCGTAWEKNEALVVPDVHAFPGHIACDPESRSEIVIPLRAPSGFVWGVLDIDSRNVDDFDKEDLAGIEPIARLLEETAARDARFLSA